MNKPSYDEQILATLGHTPAQYEELLDIQAAANHLNTDEEDEEYGCTEWGGVDYDEDDSEPLIDADDLNYNSPAFA